MEWEKKISLLVIVMVMVSTHGMIARLGVQKIWPKIADFQWLFLAAASFTDGRCFGIEQLKGLI